MLFGASFIKNKNTPNTMSKEKYTVEALMKKKIAELKEIATGLNISFNDDATKKELSKAILDEEAKIEDEANEASKDKLKAKAKPVIEYTLPETSKGVIDIGGKRYSREAAIKNQVLLARLKKAGHKAIIIKK